MGAWPSSQQGALQDNKTPAPLLKCWSFASDRDSCALCQHGGTEGRLGRVSSNLLSACCGLGSELGSVPQFMWATGHRTAHAIRSTLLQPPAPLPPSCPFEVSASVDRLLRCAGGCRDGRQVFGSDVLGGGPDEAPVLEEEGVRSHGPSMLGWALSGPRGSCPGRQGQSGRSVGFSMPRPGGAAAIGKLALSVFC